MKTKEEIRMIANEIHENVKRAIFKEDVRSACRKMKKYYKTQPEILPTAMNAMCLQTAIAINEMIAKNPGKYKKLLKQYENGS